MAECIEACRATTPTTAAEKRRAMSATTASRSAFDRSVRMQAIRMEIVANQVSTAESDAGAAVCRLKQDQPSPSSAPSLRQNSSKHSGWIVNSKACQG
jgi:septal ring-binding cell division protein DamX